MSFEDIPYDISSNIFRKYLSPSDQKNISLVSKGMNERMKDSIGSVLRPYTFTLYVYRDKILTDRKKDGEIFANILPYLSGNYFDVISSLELPLPPYIGFISYDKIIKIVCHGHINYHNNLEGTFTSEIYQLHGIIYEKHNTSFRIIGKDKEEYIVPFEVQKRIENIDNRYLHHMMKEVRKEKIIPEKYILSLLSKIFQSLGYMDERINVLDEDLSQLLAKQSFEPISSNIQIQISFRERNGIPIYLSIQQKNEFYRYISTTEANDRYIFLFNLGNVRRILLSIDIKKYYSTTIYGHNSHKIEVVMNEEEIVKCIYIHDAIVDGEKTEERHVYPKK